MEKMCTRCKKRIPLNQFRRNIRNIDGYNNYCNICLGSDKRYREANPEKHKKARKKYEEANKDKIKEQKKRYREANRENQRLYYEVNRDKLLERVKLYNDREEIKEHRKQYRKDNRARDYEKEKLYREKHPEMVIESRIRNKENDRQKCRMETLESVIGILKDTLPPEALDKLKSLNEVT